MGSGVTGSRRHGQPWRRPLSQVNHEPAPWAYRVLIRVARLFIPLLVQRHWEGQDNIPQTGGVLLVANHIGNFDPVVLGEYLIYSGRWPRFLAKIDIFNTPGLGWLARQCQQIPVLRGPPTPKSRWFMRRMHWVRGRWFPCTRKAPSPEIHWDGP